MDNIIAILNSGAYKGPSQPKKQRKQLPKLSSALDEHFKPPQSMTKSEMNDIKTQKNFYPGKTSTMPKPLKQRPTAQKHALKKSKTVQAPISSIRSKKFNIRKIKSGVKKLTPLNLITNSLPIQG